MLGTLAAGGTLGILIPPSINLIVYGAMTNTSVGRSMPRGVVPGLVHDGLFMLAIVLLCLWRPAWRGRREHGMAAGQRLALLAGLPPPMAIFVVVIGQHLRRLGDAHGIRRAGVLAAFGSRRCTGGSPSGCCTSASCPPSTPPA